jgi:hypothetical protein
MPQDIGQTFTAGGTDTAIALDQINSLVANNSADHVSNSPSHSRAAILKVQLTWAGMPSGRLNSNLKARELRRAALHRLFQWGGVSNGSASRFYSFCQAVSPQRAAELISIHSPSGIRLIATMILPMARCDIQ